MSTIPSTPAPIVPAAPAPARAAAAAPPAPDDRYSGHAATVFYSEDGERIERTRRLFCQTDDRSVALGADRSYLVSRTSAGHVLHAVDARGDVCFEHRLRDGETVAQVVADRGKGRVYVLTDARLLALNARSGRAAGHLDFEDDDHKRAITARPQGGLYLSTSEGVRLLDGGLKEEGTCALGFRPERFSARDDGTVTASYNSFPGSFVHLDPTTSKTLYRSDAVRFGTVTDDARGRQWFVEESDGMWGRTRRVVTYDPVARKAEGWLADSAAASVTPLRDDRCLVVCDRISSPRLEVHDKSSVAERAVDLDGHLRELAVNADGSRAWAVVQRFPKGAPAERVLCRIDLEGSSSAAVGWPWNPLVFNPFGGGSAGEAKEILVLKGEDTLFIPAATDDGRVVIAGPKRLQVLDADGRLLASPTDLSDLRSTLGDAKIVSRLVHGGASTNTETDGGLDAFLAAAERMGWAPADAPAPAAAQGPGPVLNEAEGCVEFKRTETFPEALAELGLASPEALDGMRDATSSLGVVLGGRRELPYPGDVASRLVVTPSRIGITDGDKELGHVDLRDGACFSAALPVQAGGDRFAAAATDVSLIWLDGRAGEFVETDLGEPVQSLSLGDRNQVYAIGEQGHILMFTPALPPGASLRTTPAPAPDGPAPTIHDGDDTVEIGGIRVPKRRTEG